MSVVSKGGIKIAVRIEVDQQDKLKKTTLLY